MTKRKWGTALVSSPKLSGDNVEENVTKRKKLEKTLKCLSDDYEIWLVKKPVQVTAKCLSEIKFPRIGKRKSVLFDSASNDNLLLQCDFSKIDSQLLYVPLGQVKTQGETVNMEALAEIHGVVSITEREADEKPVLKIHSIRKKPVFSDLTKRERLTAFGVVPRNKGKRLPNLT